MREIKFRAFIDGEMIYDLAYEEYAPINDLLKGTDNLMQFTGLLDKQGVEIYEGDILRYVDGINREVIFDNGCFGVKGAISKVVHQDKFAFSVTEVIGNIYDNSDILDLK